MPAFLYAIPNINLVSAKKIEQAGLGDVLDDSSNLSQRQAGQGPGGGHCTLLGMVKAKELIFKPESQRWAKSLNEKYYIGWYCDRPPGPGDLAREPQMAGHEVELGDGNKWLIPVGRIIGIGSALPRSLIIGKNGEVMTEELPKYAKFSSKVARLWEDLLGETGEEKENYKSEMSIRERMELVTEALGWNYHIGSDGINALKLITTSNLHKVLEAILDVPAIIEQVKKNTTRTDGSITDNGGTA